MAAARAEAAKRGSFPILLTYDDPDVDVAVIVATFTAADWAIYSDLAARDSGDAHSAAYVEQTLWPTGADAAALGDGTPALHDLVASDLHEMAGGGRDAEDGCGRSAAAALRRRCQTLRIPPRNRVWH